MMRKSCAIFVVSWILSVCTQAYTEDGRVIILGFDGVDPDLVKEWFDDLPHLKALSTSGSFHELLPTNPPQTPVSWSVFATGTNPGKTEVFDFIRRNVREEGSRSYLPDFAMLQKEYQKTYTHSFLIVSMCIIFLLLYLIIHIVITNLYLPFPPMLHHSVNFLIAFAITASVFYFAYRVIPSTVPSIKNNRKGETFWDVAGKHGYTSTIIRLPANFPPEDSDDAEVLCGLGVPDVRGRIGTPSLYTSNKEVHTAKNQFKVEILYVGNEEAIDSFIIGPMDPSLTEGKQVRIPFTIEQDISKKEVVLTVQENSIQLREGEWSDWVSFVFPCRPFIELQAIGRFYLIATGEEFLLYLSPLHFDPRNPQLPISSPSSFAEELVDAYGLYKTMGWAIDTWTLADDLVEEELFVDDVAFTVEGFRRIMEGLLEDAPVDIYVQVFSYTDRVSHLFWRFLDTSHPAYDEEKAKKYEQVIKNAYMKMDAIVGEAMSHVRENDLFIVCSDHGFASWRRSIHLNTWLVENGYMVLKDPEMRDIKTLDDLWGQDRDPWRNVDWKQTRAYALGLGAIYINLRGRESQGIVMPGEEYSNLCEEIKQKLGSLVDNATNVNPISKVYHRDEIYTSYDPDIIPDLRVSNKKGYRVSWQTALGGAPANIFEDNLRKWSADHCSMDPADVMGVLFCNQKLDGDIAHIRDVSATVLSYLGISIPTEMEGRSLLRD